MKARKEILTAALLSASVGLGAQSAFAQSGPGSGSTMPRSQERTGPIAPTPGPEMQQPTIPGQPAPGLPQSEPIPGRPGTIPERVEPPRAGDTQKNMVVTSADIKKAQDALKAKGLNPGSDGQLDAKTQQALREFQKSNDLTVTGVLDEKTAEKLGVNLGADKKTMPKTGRGTDSSPTSGGSLR